MFSCAYILYKLYNIYYINCNRYMCVCVYLNLNYTGMGWVGREKIRMGFIINNDLELNVE